MSRSNRESSAILEVYPPTSPADEGDALVAAAQRRRRKAREAKSALEANDATIADAISPDEIVPMHDDSDDELLPTSKRRRRSAPRTGSAATKEEEPKPSSPTVPPLKKRGPTAWNAFCICVALVVLVLSVAAMANLPRPLPVTNVRVTWLDGPRAPQAEVDAWLANFPEREQLADANGWVMDKLTKHLLAQPGVAEVRRITMVQQPSTSGGKANLGRVLQVEIGMRIPYMPGVLASGQRVWIDQDGVVLPGSLAGPTRRRPLLTSLEAGSLYLPAAVAMWRRLEPHLEQGAITAINCNDQLDDRGERGIVLYAQGNSRLIWGRPDEEKLGHDAEAKARDLIQTIRCQGDLSRVAVVNVRFAKPFYTLK